MTTYTIPDGHKFACLGLINAYADGIYSPIQIGSNFFIHSGAPFVFDDEDWRDQLGRRQMEAFTKARLVLVKTAPAERPGVLDQQFENLKLPPNDLLTSLALHGTAHHDGALFVGGEVRAGRIQVRAISELPGIFAHRKVRPTPVAPTIIESVITVVDGLEEIRRTCLEEPLAFRRFRRGLMSLCMALQESGLPARNHLFVKALDALLFTPQGGGTREFKARGAQLMDGAEKEKRLEEMYELRSKWEHLGEWPKKWGSDIMSEEDMNDRAMLRVYESEVLALGAYRRILACPLLRSQFKTNEQISEFWGSPSEDIAARWRERIDVDAAIQAKYRQR